MHASYDVTEKYIQDLVTLATFVTLATREILTHELYHPPYNVEDHQSHKKIKVKMRVCCITNISVRGFKVLCMF